MENSDPNLLFVSYSLWELTWVPKEEVYRSVFSIQPFVLNNPAIFHCTFTKWMTWATRVQCDHQKSWDFEEQWCTIEKVDLQKKGRP